MPTTTKKADNLDLWNRREKTDPAMTKGVNQRGGFTSVCAQYQKKNATDEWGHFGATWGIKDLVYTCLRNAAGEVVEIALLAVFWYPGGEFPISTDMKYQPGNDSRKKLRTDAMTKALSDLGFNADVFMGKFDDNKYVNEMKELFGNNGNAPPKGSGRAEVKDFLDDKPPEQSTDRQEFEVAINELVRRDVPVCPQLPQSKYTNWGREICAAAKVNTIPEATAWAKEHAHFKPIQDLAGKVTGAELILEPTP